MRFLLLLFGICLLACIGKEQPQTLEPLQFYGIVNGREYYIDLPEEISQSKGNDLQCIMMGDTIFIQFKHK